MRLALLGGALALLTAASAADAQGVFAQPPPIDPASICAPGSAPPQSEMVGGWAGIAGTCLRSDARVPRITRATTATTVTGGAFTVTWTAPLPVAPDIVLTPIAAGGASVHCELTAPPTTTTVAGRCVTLAVASILAAGAGQQVQVIAIPPTQ